MPIKFNPFFKGPLSLQPESLSTAEGDARYLKLDASNDPVTGDLLFDGNRKIIGGTATTADLTLQTTSGVGATGADMHFLVGNNGGTEAVTVLNNGKVGINTTTPTHTLDVRDNAARFAGKSNWLKVFNVNNVTLVELTDSNNASLSNSSIYLVRLYTTGTGTDNSSSFLVRWNEDTSVWVIKILGASEPTTTTNNVPWLVLDSGVVKVKTNHTSLYNVRAYVEEYQVIETGITSHFFGADWEKISNNYHAEGTVSSSGGFLSTGGGSSGVGTQTMASSAYVQSRGSGNLVTNGSGSLGNNYNFSTYTFDAVETHGGGGSFRVADNVTRFSDELIPVDSQKAYVLTLWTKAGNIDGTHYDATNRAYVGVAPFDIDGLAITPFNFSKSAGSTDTTLAVQLNPGDTTVTLTDGTGWYNGATAHNRNFAWFGYTNSKGYTYPNYTYTRNLSSNYSSNSSLGAWNASGITGNVITLRVPWAGPTVTAGTAIRNCLSGGNYKYIAISNLQMTQTWTRYQGVIAGEDTTGVIYNNLFPLGTAYVKLITIANYLLPAIDNYTRFSDIDFREIGHDNYPVVNRLNQNKDFQIRGVSDSNLIYTDADTNRLGVGTASPISKLDVRYSGSDDYVAVFGQSSASYNAKILLSRASNVRQSNVVHALGYAIEWVSGMLYNAGSATTGYHIATGQNLADAKLTVTTAGDVGIGTQTPASKLDVAGTVRADGLRLDVTPTAEVIVPTHTITISVNGVDYKIPIAV